jgi:hypothetical protein
MTKPLFLSSLFLLATGCGGSGGKNSQGELAEALVQGLNASNTNALTKLYLKKSKIKRSVRCESTDEWNEWDEEFKKEKQACQEAQKATEEAGTVDYIGFEQTHIEVLPVGTEIGPGCETIKDISFIRVKLKFSTTNEHGKIKKKTKSTGMIGIGGKYYAEDWCSRLSPGGYYSRGVEDLAESVQGGLESGKIGDVGRDVGR